MCEPDVEGLPLLPGLTFEDPTKLKFHRSQFFEFKQGFRHVRPYAPAAGKYPRDIDSIRYLELENDVIAYDPALTYGRTREYPLPAFRPHYVIYDKKCLTFKAFFKQAVFNSPDENYRVRVVNIIYFLDDDTLTVIEPPIDNSGIAQGRLIRRGRVPKCGHETGIYLHWKDFNLGIDLPICGIVFHIVDCDLFTKEFLLSQGVEVNDPECMPPDPYTQKRNVSLGIQRVTPKVDDKLRRFLEYDGRVLKFRAVWDNRDSEHGDLSSYVVRYYLMDDTVEVCEIHQRNDGKDPFKLLLKKTKLPKNYKDVPAYYPSIYLEISDKEVEEYYTPADFIIGKTIFVFGRRMLLHKCDEETRTYYKKALNITQPENFEVEEKEKPKPPEPPPPHIGYGTLEDSLASCLHSSPKPPKKDAIKEILNMNKYLRYTAKLRTTHPEDEIRDFVIYYSLSDSTIKIAEPPKDNSGHVGGRFLSPTLVPKPGSHPDYPEYYSPADFYIGAVLTINEFKFEIVGADLQVYRYMEANPEKFKPEVVDTVRNYMAGKGLLKDDIGTIAKNLLNPEEFPTTKVCESDPNATPCKPDPCEYKYKPCQRDDTKPLPFEPPKELPHHCYECPPLTARVPEECQEGAPPEARVDELSGKLVFK